MLFAKRQLLATRFGRYLGSHTEPTVTSPEPTIDIDACYALLGESNHGQGTASDLPRLINQIITAYEKHTGHWLEPEQVALAAIRQDVQYQANILEHHFPKPTDHSTELHSTRKTSFLRLTLLADALQLNHLSTTYSLPCPSQLPSCQRKLNVLLDEISMPEIEASGRELRERCTQTLIRKGISPDALQACWHLKMRYLNSQTSLLMKCMPIDMMRDVFESQHKQQFGFALKGEAILIEALEIGVKLHTPCQPDTPAENAYVNALMSQWKADPNTPGSWQRCRDKSHSPTVDMRFLNCSVLQNILAIHIANPADLTMSNFFLRNLKKDVDEAALHN